MLQRIQTIFLLLVVILGAVFMFIPVIEYEGVKSFHQMGAYHTTTADGISVFGNMGVGALGGLVIVLSLVVMLLFKNRQLQMKLCKLNILLIALQITAIVFYSDAAEVVVANLVPDSPKTNIQLGAGIPVLSLILTYLAIRFIKKDDKLVRAADRLR